MVVAIDTSSARVSEVLQLQAVLDTSRCYKESVDHVVLSTELYRTSENLHFLRTCLKPVRQRCGPDRVKAFNLARASGPGKL